ncbi:MAG: hypothetical protein ACLU0O_02800 [Collinsella sp.]
MLKHSNPRCGRSSRSPTPAAGAWVSKMSQPPTILTLRDSLRTRLAISRSVYMLAPSR